MTDISGHEKMATLKDSGVDTAAAATTSLILVRQVVGVGFMPAVGGCSGNGDLPCLFQRLNCPLNTLSTNTGQNNQFSD
ncbi:hypothetical protein OkiPb00232_48120 [Escherichia coli]|nr:hypothetical protein BvCmsKSP022_05146 [Escherichia coli]